MDPYSPDLDLVEPLIYPLAGQREQFKQLALKLKDLNWQSPQDSYYILSRRWLERFYIHISYKEFINGEEPSKYLGGPKLWSINEDLVLEQKEALFKYFPLQTHKWNFWLKPDLKYEKHYMKVSDEVWVTLKNFNNNNAFPIMRDTFGPQKQLEVYLKKVRIGIVNQSILGNIKGEKVGKLFSGYLQTSNFVRLSEWITSIERTVKTFKQYEFEPGCIRVWKMTSFNTPEKLFAEIKDQLIGQSQDFNIYLRSETLLNPETMVTVEDCEITDDDLLIIDAKEKNKSYCITNEPPKKQQKCSWCFSSKQIILGCECKSVNYCSEDCQNKDQKFHVKNCQIAQKKMIKDLSRRPDSIDGKCGLNNLGNTCFMNSGLQCLSNSALLTDYFINDFYLNDINLVNVLGTHGEISQAFADLLKNLWFGREHVYSPIMFKKCLAKYLPIFSGYQQHDAHEFVMYLLDLIHEDVNLVKQKPQINWTESNGREDALVAIEHWDCHTMRNQSQIVELFQGQQKSKIQCGHCGHISILYEPYTSIPLPLIQNNQSSDQVTIFLVKSAKSYKPYQIKIQDHYQVSDLKQKIQQQLKCDQLVYTLAGRTFHEQIMDMEDIQSFKQKLKNTKLLVRYPTEYELSIPLQDQVAVAVSLYDSTSSGSSIHKIEPRNLIFARYSTLSQVHEQLFEQYKGVLGVKIGTFDENSYLNILNNKFEILLKSNSGQLCYYSGNLNCPGCPLPFTNSMTIHDLISKIKDNYFKLEFMIKIKTEFEESKTNDSIEANNCDSGATSLYECLKLYQSKVTLDKDNMWYCPQCKQHQISTQELQIYSTPIYLILYLKRFGDSKHMLQEKITQGIEYPETLDLKDFVLNQYLPRDYIQGIGKSHSQDKQSAPLLYDLYGVVNHYGSMDGGHYTAFSKNRYDKKFYEYNDCSVNQVNNIQTNAAYMLFYERRQV